MGKTGKNLKSFQQVYNSIIPYRSNNYQVVHTKVRDELGPQSTEAPAWRSGDPDALAEAEWCGFWGSSWLWEEGMSFCSFFSGKDPYFLLVK